MNGRIIRQDGNSRLALPRVGKIKIGMKNDKGYPMSVDYFIPTGKYAALFIKAYGDKPQTIQIVFPEDDPNNVCREEYEYRDDSGALIARGDGEEFKVWNGREYQRLTTQEHPHLMDAVAKRYPVKRGDGWNVRLTMNFIVPTVKGIAGVWTLETNGALSSIPQVRDTFDCILRERGFVRGIIFDLSVQFAKSQKPNSRSKYPVISLIPNESDENVERIKSVFTPLIEKKGEKVLPS